MVVLHLGFRLRIRIRVRLVLQLFVLLIFALLLVFHVFARVEYWLIKSHSTIYDQISFETPHACHILAVCLGWCKTKPGF